MSIFQYLKGAIGRVVMDLWQVQVEEFQYLKGAIGRRPGQPRPIRIGPISIPQRCDWKPRQKLADALSQLHFNTSKVRLEVRPQGDRWWHIEPISIPQRCDWKRCGDGSRRSCTQFQYLKGAIGSPGSAPRKVRRSPFQYLKGAIGRPADVLIEAGSLYFNTSKVRLEARSLQLQSAAEQR